jgi:hypothetical protein
LLPAPATVYCMVWKCFAAWNSGNLNASSHRGIVSLSAELSPTLRRSASRNSSSWRWARRWCHRSNWASVSLLLVSLPRGLKCSVWPRSPHCPDVFSDHPRRTT